MEHARDAKEAKESIQFCRRNLHTFRKVVVKTLSVEACDLIILAAMVANDLAGRLAECRYVVRPRLDVRRIESLGYGGVVSCKR